jgi:hypothetical protein
MASKDYAGKSAYRGPVAARYDDDRRVEAVWLQEQEFVRAWVQTLPPGRALLDIPTGTGRFLEFFLDQKLDVYAQDISADMLAEIRRQHPAIDATKLCISPGDAEHLDLADEAVDYVLSWRFLHLVPMPVVNDVIREFRRVCRGQIVVQVFAVDPARDRGRFWPEVKNRLRPFWRLLRPLPPPEPTTPWSHITSYSHPEERLLAAFAAAGLLVDRMHTFDPATSFPTRVYFLSRQDKSAPRCPVP